MMAVGEFDLARFKTAQSPVFDTVLAELRAGRKRSHWMWFIFPQLRGLGHSPTAQFYAIGSLDEARAYLTDPVLGHRLRLATKEVLDRQDASAHDIFGSPDDLKFRSSMTLFDAAQGQTDPVFRQALDRYFAGRPDLQTLTLLRNG